MNNNNLYNNNNFIGITHLDNVKITSNFIIQTSNILEQHILNTSNTLEGHLSNTSNILEGKIFNTSNTLEGHILDAKNFNINYTNALRTDVNKWINEEIEHNILPPVDIKHTYIYNSNLLGEIRFTTKGTPQYVLNENRNYIIKISENGGLYLYYNYQFQYPTVLGGWYNVMDSIRDGYAYQATNGALLGEIQIAINGINSQLIALESGMGAIAANVELLNGMTVEEIDTIINDTQNMNLGAIFNNASILGISGLGLLGILSGVTAGILYNNYITAQLKELEKMNNPNITETQKNNYIQDLKNIAIDNYTELNTYISNLSIAQGFINSNIATQQYIKNLKCDNLNLNTGNITNINYINAANINSEGNIKQNNILLDNIYLTSNHLYNLSYTYTAERQYPSKLYTTTQPEDTITLLNKLVYRSLLYLDTQSITYGSGFYEIFSSSSFDTPTTKDKLFNYNITDSIYPRWAINQYNSGTGNYQENNSIDNVYYGDWIIIKTPQPILLTRYRIYQRSDFLTKAPSLWKVYGSKDGITFTEITEAHQTTRLTSYTGTYYEKSLASSFTTLYNYIGFVFSALLSVSGATDLSFAELQIFGKEIVSNSIVSNIYTTSNATKNIVQYECPFLSKKYGFYISITTPININSTTFYKYDIDLRQYSVKGFIDVGSGSGDPYRLFKVKIMLAPLYFSTITNGLPDVCYYDIFMSFKASAAPGGVAGLNCAAIGFPTNTTLTNILPNNLFLIRNGQNSIDYITVISRSPADCRCILEDLLS